MSDNIIKLPNVRLSFPTIFTAEAFNDGDPKFSAAYLIDPSTEQGEKTIKEIEAEIQRVAEEKWGKGKIPKSMKPCLHDGNEKDYDGYQDMMFITASNKKKPTLIKKVDGVNVEANEDDLYAGCYVHATVTFWAQDNSFGKRVNANLRLILKVKDGEAFGSGAVNADEEAAGFDDFETDDDLI